MKEHKKKTGGKQKSQQNRAGKVTGRKPPSRKKSADSTVSTEQASEKKALPENPWSGEKVQRMVKKSSAKESKPLSAPLRKKTAGASSWKSKSKDTTAQAPAVKNPPPPITKPDQSGLTRLNKYIAQAGICARRKADELIKDGRVKVNGVVVTEMGIKIAQGDAVEVNGNLISAVTHDYILMHKPTNIITSNQDDRERRIVLDLIEDEKLKKKGLFPVGRLDRNTTGVLLITNDGELAHRLMHPKYEIQKLYIVRTKENVQPHELEKLQIGVDINGETYRMDEVAYMNLPKHNELGVSLHEGKNRHIRRMMESLGHKVTRLERVRYAGLTTEDVRPGKWRRLDSVEIRRLRRLVKLR
ncbi:MAG: pseudouridine synthase [Rhodothermales bacterium]